MDERISELYSISRIENFLVGKPEEKKKNQKQKRLGNAEKLIMARWSVEELVHLEGGSRKTFWGMTGVARDWEKVSKKRRRVVNRKNSQLKILRSCDCADHFVGIINQAVLFQSGRRFEMHGVAVGQHQLTIPLSNYRFDVWQQMGEKVGHAVVT